MVRSIRKVDPVKVFRQPDTAIGSHQTTTTQPTDDQVDGPEDNIPLLSMAESVVPSPVVAESPVLCELTNTSDVVPTVPFGAVHQGHQVIYGALALVGAVHQLPLGHQLMYGARAPAAVRFKRAQATMLRTETAQSDMSFSAVPDSGNRESPELATFESTYVSVSRAGGIGVPWTQMDFTFFKDLNPCSPPAPAEPVPDWRNTRDISVKADTSHVQSLEHLSLQIQDLMGSQMKLNTELWELKQQVCSNCQDLEGLRREPQNRFVAPSLRHSSAPRPSPPPVLSTTTKNLGYDKTEDMLANVQGHAARGLETLHRHTARAVQHFLDSSWFASMGRLSSRSC